MVDVSEKAPTRRTAQAEARVRMSSQAAEALRVATLSKGDALVTAQLAANLIPLAHPLALAHVDVRLEWAENAELRIRAHASTTAQTGVELEAMVAVAIAALTIYDMAKSLDKGIVVESVRLLQKSGGKSGTYRRD
jgi:cyclic pyranopterin phosphate synthase